MAGSYNHTVTKSGKLRSPKNMTNATETQGDAYETIEEMYGMIWFLANGDPLEVEKARENYREGVDSWSPGRQK